MFAEKRYTGAPHTYCTVPQNLIGRPLLNLVDQRLTYTMSTTYNLEPQPTAKVVLQTTSGDIELELFAKQTPLASRNFLQLCLDGYYHDTIFHRLIPGFIVQGGDPTGTGEGGESIYDDGRPFADEFHSRLKFNRRGLLGMANGGTKDDNGSQFFLTLDKTDELNGKNTLFGRVVGDTIYNLMKIGEADLSGEEGSDRPLYPTKITLTEVLVNPFEGMVPMQLVKRTGAADGVVQEKDKGRLKKRKAGGRKTGKTLLSFGDDEDDGSMGQMVKKARFNPKLIDGEEAGDNKSVNGDLNKGGSADDKVRKKNRSTSSTSAPVEVDAAPTRPLTTVVAATTMMSSAKARSPSPPTSPEPEPVSKISSLLDRTNAQIADLKASMRRTIPSSAKNSSAGVATKKSALELMIPSNSIRGRKRRVGRGSDRMENEADDRRTLDLLNQFRAKLDGMSTEVIKPSSSSPTKAIERKEYDKAEGDGQEGGGEGGEEEEEEVEEKLCDLHFIANCQSCQAWDRPRRRRRHRQHDHHHRGQKVERSLSGEVNDDDNSDQGISNGPGNMDYDHNDDDDDESDESDGDQEEWMNHSLTFEKDRLGKDLAWKQRNEELLFLDPLEKKQKMKKKEEEDGGVGGGGGGMMMMVMKGEKNRLG